LSKILTGLDKSLKIIYYRPLNMSSSRLILIFLGFIFLIIVILTSGQIAGALRSRFGNFIPGGTKVAGISPTPSPAKSPVKPTITPTSGAGNGAVYRNNKIDTNQTPATGPADLALALMGAGSGLGYLLRKISSKG
jgi:hypothetical protein